MPFNRTRNTHYPVVAIVDDNQVRRERMARTLAPLYRIAAYPEFEPAIAMMRHPPAVMILDEAVRPHGRRDMVRTLRTEPALRGSMIVVCRAKPNRVEHVHHYPDAPPDAMLEKPFPRRDLLSAVSGLVSRNAEGKWETLPPRARQALKESLALYSGFGELLRRGEPLEHDRLQSACAPVIDAVISSDYKGLLGAVRDHDNLSYVHSVRVATLLALFGHTIGLTGDALTVLTCGGLVHDLGKLSIPDEVLNKTGTLTPAEMAQVRGHVEATGTYLQTHSNLPKGIITIAAQHHERVDGSGYPLGLKGDGLNDLARMAAIVDVFTAMTDRRAYKPPLSAENALSVMTGEMAGQLDQRLLRLFNEMLRDASGGIG